MVQNIGAQPRLGHVKIIVGAWTPSASVDRRPGHFSVNLSHHFCVFLLEAADKIKQFLEKVRN